MHEEQQRCATLKSRGVLDDDCDVLQSNVMVNNTARRADVGQRLRGVLRVPVQVGPVEQPLECSIRFKQRVVL